MAEASPELPSVLQELWDLEWQRNRQIMLILCGSYIGFMEREVLGEKSSCSAGGQLRFCCGLSDFGRLPSSILDFP